MPSLRSLLNRSCCSTAAMCLTFAASFALASPASAQRGGNGGGDDGGLAGGPIPTGACCTGPNGECVVMTQAQCQSLNPPGNYQGDGVTCLESVCSDIGRCCINNLNNGSAMCSSLTLWACVNTTNNNWVYWQSEPASCSTACEPLGACCYETGGGSYGCYITAEFICGIYGGAWGGQASTCQNFNCDNNVGACCTEQGCSLSTNLNCTGEFLGIGSSCADCAAGPGVGMCCVDDQCLMLTRDECNQQSGTFYGEGVECDFDYFCGDPPEAGACCLPNGSCMFTTQSICDDNSGVFTDIDVLCEDVDCGGPGACCYNNGQSCDVMDEGLCNKLTGTFMGTGSECETVTCPGPLGRCCLQNPNGTSACLTLSFADCQNTPGALTWSGGSTCATGPPCPSFGACCMPNGSCIAATSTGCANQGGIYKGNGTTCADTDGNGKAEHCEKPGDTNNDGVVNVTDLLAVISAWGPCPAPCTKDVAPIPNGDGVVNVSDLLAVISNWG